MYEAYWQLERRPFENSFDEACYYPGESHQGAMLKLRYAVENRQGAALFVRTVGERKIAVGRAPAAAFASKFSSVRAFGVSADAGRIVAVVPGRRAGSTGSSVRPRQRTNGIEQTVRRIQHFLEENNSADQHAVVAVDEAHLLDDTRASRRCGWC